MNDQGPFSKLLENIGEPTLQSLERLRLVELDCEGREDPNSFYLTFTLSNPPIINWSYNSKLLLGVDKLDYESYYTRIHPAWFPIHIAFGTAGYKVERKMYKDSSVQNTIYTVNIPILHEDGSYHWYNQVSIPIAFDAKGQLVSHLNQYHRLCPYDRLIPSKPKITSKGDYLSGFDEMFAEAGNAAIPDCLSPLLSTSAQRIVHTYRKLATKEGNGSWVAPAKKEVREELGLSATAINKANVRIIKVLKKNFPVSITRDVAGFAVFLNDLCGLPGAFTPK